MTVSEEIRLVKIRPADGDDEILRLVIEYGYILPETLAKITGRSEKVIERRLRQLGDGGQYEDGLKLVAPLQIPKRMAGYAWYATRKGCKIAHERGLVPKMYFPSNSRSNSYLPHDLLISDFHYALWKTYGADLEWEQRDLKDNWGSNANATQHINPDGFFSVKLNGKFLCAFLELERTRMTKHVEGQSNLVRKCLAYAEYAKLNLFEKKYGADNFYLLIIRPTAAMLDNFCDLLRNHGRPLNSGRFLLTDFKGMLTPDKAVFRWPISDTYISLADIAK